MVYSALTSTVDLGFLYSKTRLMPNTADETELDGLRALNPQVISAIYDLYFPIVFRYVSYRIGDPTRAEDIASDVFLRLLEAARSSRAPRTNLKAWLLSTSAHVVDDSFRKAYRQPTTELPDSLAGPISDPQHEVEHRERHHQVHRALAYLTRDQQHVLALRFGDGCSLEETASIMKKSVNAIKQLQLRALAALNRKIGEAP